MHLGAAAATFVVLCAVDASALGSGDHAASLSISADVDVAAEKPQGRRIMRLEKSVAVALNSKGASELETTSLSDPTHHTWAQLQGTCTDQTSTKRYGQYCTGNDAGGLACESDAADVTTLAACKLKCNFACSGIAWSLVAAGGETNDQCIVFIGGCADSGAGSGDLHGLTYYKKPPLPPIAMENWVRMSGHCTAFEDFKRYGVLCSGEDVGERACEPGSAAVESLPQCKAACEGHCVAIAWLEVPDRTNINQCITYHGECVDSGPGTPTHGLVYYEKPFDPPVRGPGDGTAARCNTFTCPDEWFLRKEAPDIACKNADACTQTADRARCCKILSKEGAGKKCGGANGLNWFDDWSLEDCVTWAMNNGASYFLYGTGSKAKRCWWQQSDAPVFCQGNSCCHCGDAWEPHFTKLATGKTCGYHYQAEPEATSIAACATACRDVEGCVLFSYGTGLGCRVSKVGVSSSAEPAPGSGLTTGMGLDASTIAKSCATLPITGAGSTKIAGGAVYNMDQSDADKISASNGLYKVKVKTSVTYTVPAASLPITAATRSIATLYSTNWPNNFCVDFDITFPEKLSGSAYGYGGAIVMLGQVYLTLTQSSKLLVPGTGGFGFMAIEQSNGAGPYYATVQVGAPGTRHAATFCYLAAKNKPSWAVDGASIRADYSHGRGARFPEFRDVPLSILAASHTGSGNGEDMSGGILHSLSIRSAEPCTMETGEYDFYKLA